ncbi:MAG TPA: TerC family protein [Candidatus Acidoferrum sp.]|nr:TerC family protein [Candidatus Acidoferrum sp.]
MVITIWFWLGFIGFVLLLLAFDLGVLHRRPKTVSVREALLLSFLYVVLAGIFNVGVFHLLGEQAGYEFLTGYLIEKSLSLDNVFVFVLIFTHFAVPPQYQHRVLFWGILGALIMRGLLIAAGAALISTVHWIVLLFGAFLVLTGIKMLLSINVEPDLANNRIIAFTRRHLRVTNEYDGQKFFIRKEGALWATPLFLALIIIEFTDLVFAVDSIPAIFAITQEPFIVLTANVFAILGLRALYFALAGVIHRFHYLKYGLSLVLCVVGAKMILNGIFGEKVMPTEIALATTGTLIGGSIVLSLIKTKMKPPVPAPAFTGWVPGSPQQPAKPESQSKGGAT